MAADDGPTIRACASTLREGDLIYRHRGNPGGYPVLRVEGPYDDGTVVVVYRAPTYGWENRAGDKGRMSSTGMGEVSLAPCSPDTRIPARRT